MPPAEGRPFGRCFVLFAFLLFQIACQPASPPDQPSSLSAADSKTLQSKTGKDAAYFLRQIANMSRWARPYPNETAILRSSHTAKEPVDANVFNGEDYKIDGEVWRTLVDEKGPGCITRIWMPDSAAGRLRFYFDQEQNPRLEMDIQEFFSNWMPSASYLILSSTDTGCGQVSYFPFPFRKHCTVLCNTDDSEFQYQFNIRKFSESEDIISFSGQSDPSLLDALEEVHTFFTTPAIQKYQPLQKQEFSGTLQPNQNQMLVNLPGPGAIDYFEIQIKNPTMQILNNIQFEMYWDSMNLPSVHCSLRQFFCNIDLQNDWNSFPMGFLKEPGIFYCQFYMPFKKKAQLFLKNENTAPVEILFRYHTDIDPEKIPDEPLYLFVRSNKEDYYNGQIYPMMEFEGSGNFIGMDVIGYTESQFQKFFFLEGDEYVFVDGEALPSIAGTGMDHRFNADDRLKTTHFFWFPTHGCLEKVEYEDKKDEKRFFVSGSNLYRFSLLDDIPFYSSLIMLQEIGDPLQHIQAENPELNSQTLFNWVCFWYGKMSAAKTPRREQAFYFTVSQREDDAPTEKSPVMIGANLRLQLPRGKWWIHYAPVGNLNDVRHALQEVQ